MKAWEEKAISFLQESLYPVPQELNEIDWKSDLSTNTERLAHHISAFSNYSRGGFLAIGINNNGESCPLSKSEMDEIIKKIGNIAIIILHNQ